MSIPADVRNGQRVVVSPVLRKDVIKEWTEDDIRIYGMEVCLIQASRCEDIYDILIYRYSTDNVPLMRVSVKDLRRLMYKWEIIQSPQGALKVKRNITPQRDAEEQE